MTDAPKRAYGLLIHTVMQYGFERIVAKLIVREGDADHPINPDGSGESFVYRGVPKHMEGLDLDGLGMYGFVSDGCSGDAPRFIGYDVEYREVFCVDQRKVARMVKTFARVQRRFEKDRPSEHGEALVCLAAALQLTFCVWNRDETQRSSYSENKWRWATIPEGRDHYRHLVNLAVAREVERKGGRAA